MVAVTVHAATRVERTSVLPRVCGAVLAASGTIASIVGIVLFAWHGDITALLPGLDDAQIATAFAELGWSPAAVIATAAVVQLTMVVVTAVSAAFILANTRATVFHAVLATTLVFFVATATTAFDGWALVAPGIADTGTAVTALACGAFFSLSAVFPTGTFVQRWAVAIPAAWAIVIGVSVAYPWWEGPTWAVIAMSALAVLAVGGAIVAQVQRFRRISDRAQRQQTKWVVLALVAYLGALLPVFFVPPGWLDSLSGGVGVAVQLARGLVVGLLLTLIPVSISIAIARYRLFDVDLVIRRTLVAVGLIALITALSLGIIGAAALLWTGSGPIATVVAVVCAAVVAHPLRVWLQRRATRWVYGRRGDPYGVVSGLGEDLKTLDTADAIAARIAEVVVDDLRYSSASVELDGGSVIARGDPDARIAARVPLTHDDDVLGVLTIGADAGDRVSAATERLVAAVAAQGALALGIVRATDTVRRSRERLLVAREEERQRLYRDLHDGLGPGLAGARQRIDAATRLSAAHPEDSTRLLAEASDAIAVMLGDVRALVHGLRPPALDELGLAEAVRHAVRPLATPAGVEIDVGRAPSVPAAVEVAAYRIAVEAVTNAARHSAASRVVVSFTAHAATLVVDVRDDGVGLRGAAEGRGRRSMRERADELGGTLTVSDLAPGTAVRATLPLRAGGGE